MSLKIAQDYEYVGDNYWNWRVWLDGSDVELDGIADVTYTLHRTFKDPVRTINDRRTSFELRTSGWGVFRIFADIRLKVGEHRHMHHDLDLRYP